MRPTTSSKVLILWVSALCFEGKDGHVTDGGLCMREASGQVYVSVSVIELISSEMVFRSLQSVLYNG